MAIEPSFFAIAHFQGMIPTLQRKGIDKSLKRMRSKGFLIKIQNWLVSLVFRHPNFRALKP
jgi:hypothetical protein